MITGQLIGLFVLGYLIGAIPFGVIAGRLMRGIDVRDYGSGGMGMTNVMRTVGRKAGLLVMIADLLKGAGAVALAWPIIGSSPDMLGWGHAVAGMAAVVGHSWPVYIRFRGGRGIATGAGALLVIYWPVALISVVVFIAVVRLTRYVSLGSILATLAMLLSMILFVVVYDREPVASIAFAAVVAAVIIFRHRGNISRLRSHTESKIGQKVKTS